MATTLFQGDFTIFRISYVQRRKYLFCEEKPRRRLNQLCFASKGRGFGPEPAKGDKDTTRKTSTKRSSTPLDPSKGTSDQPMMRNGQAPGLLSGREVSSNSNNIVSDRQFMEKLEAVRRYAREKKNAEAEKLTQSIDYDAPIESDKSTMGLGTKVGVGIAVVVFGLVFAFGDFLPSGSINSDEVQIAEKKLPDEQKAILKSQLQNFEETLSTSPNDLSALEGAAVTLAELGEYKEASSYLEKLIKGRPEDPEAYRLLGEVKYEMKDFENSATAYKNSLSASKEIELETLRGLTNSLLAAKKPEEAVKVLLSTSEQINAASQLRPDKTGDVNEKATKDQENADPIQVHLLLGKAYSDWGHVSDAVAVYDQLISHYPNDFRGYLAKGIILKENGKAGDAERMFIQAKFFAPDKAKSLVDRYARN